MTDPGDLPTRFTNTNVPPPTSAVTGEHRDQMVGPYKLVEILGEGGFGTVWLAERREPMVQRVALKIIKPGMDSKAVISRFEQERQALAVMDHPNVAKVFDGGVTEHGRPYFIMEYVQGAPITSFCDRHRYTIKQRLELFITVCDAVQHAHHKGIIHRDIKPSNVLVSMSEGKPLAKVIDFGIAKATESSDVQNSVFSIEGQFIGTPEYMSPEQAGGRADIDTRTDVYSLGVLLYELLVGRLPFEPSTLRMRGMDEIRRIIREETPPNPSTRFSTVKADGATIAEARRGTHASLLRQLRQELEWIPLKAMRKERDRRYDSPGAFAEDVRRYLDGRPLHAAPESRIYLARKFVRRNKVQVGAAVIVLFALSAGLIVSLWQRGEAIKARDAEKERAEQLKQVSDFQSSMLSQIDTTKAGADLMTDVRARFLAALEQDGVSQADRERRATTFGTELERVNATDTAAALIDRTILKPAAETIDAQFKDQPLVDASLRQALADLYEAIGLYDAAYPLQQSCLATRRRLLGDEHPDTLISINVMGVVLQDQGKLDQAEPYLREALESRRRVLGENHPDTLVSLNNLALLLQEKGQLAEAEPYYREALAKYRRVRGEDHLSTLISISNLGFVLQAQRKLAEAELYYREAIEKSRRVLGAEHPSTLISIDNMGLLLRDQGKLAEAEPFIREAMDKNRHVLGEDHPDTLNSINNLGVLLREQGKLPEAAPYLRESLEKRRRMLGDAHPAALNSIHNMGLLLRDQGKYQEAIDLLAPTEQDFRKAFSDENIVRIAAFLSNLGRVRIGLGYDAERFALAEANLLEAHPVYLADKHRGPTHKDTRGCVQGLVDLYTAWNAAEPGKGYDAKAAEWKAKLEVPKPDAAEMK